MGWLDLPTKSQINVLYGWFRWKMPTAEAKDALDWLEKNATRRQVSEEMSRVRKLYIANNLTREDCFSSPVWKDYFNTKVKEEEKNERD